MKSIAAIILVLATWVTPAVFADDAPSAFAPFEDECRKELGIELTQKLTPGLTLGKLRDCIRNRTSDARGPIPERNRPTLRNRIERALQQALKLQRQTSGNGVVSPSEPSRDFERACRETLNIAKETVLQPGILKQKLLTCVDRLHSEESRAANIRRRSGSVLERTREIGDKVLGKEKDLLKGKLESSGAAGRFRIHQQRPIDKDRLQNIRDSLRARTDFSNEYRKNSNAEKRLRAEQCRKFKGAERGACLREALSDE